MKLFIRYNSTARLCGNWNFTKSNQYRPNYNGNSRENKDIHGAHRKQTLETFYTFNFDHLIKKNF